MRIGKFCFHPIPFSINTKSYVIRLLSRWSRSSLLLDLSYFSASNDLPDRAVCPPPPLKKLELYHIEKFGMDGLKKLICYINSDKISDGLEVLHVAQCSKLEGTEDNIK